MLMAPDPVFKLSSYEKWFFGSPIGFGLLCLGGLASTAYAGNGSWQYPVKAMAILFLAAGTAFAAGAFLGFLFGVPRVAPPAVVGAPALATGTPTPATGTAPAATGTAVITSTANLVEIADWLLKLLLGAGLTQFRSILHAVRQVSTDLGAGVAIPTGSGIERGVAISFSIGYFFVWGCIMSYVLTQEYIPQILERRVP